MRDSGAVRMFIHMSVIPFVREKSNTGDSGYGVGLSVPLNGVHLVQGKVCMAVCPALTVQELSYELKLVS